MAYITVGSKFTPFTYEEKVRPFVQYNEAYNDIEDKYLTMQEKAAQVGALIDPNTSPEAYKLYQNYQNAIQAAFDNLYSNGLTNTNRAMFSDIRKEQVPALTSLTSDIARREKAKEAFDKVWYGKEHDFIGKNPHDTSLDEWLGGKTPNAKGLSSSELSAYVAAGTKAASDRAYQTYQKNGYMISKTGLDQSEVDSLMYALSTGSRFDDSTTTGKYLNKVLDDVIEFIDTDVYSRFGFNDEEEFTQQNLDEINAAINYGLRIGFTHDQKATPISKEDKDPTDVETPPSYFPGANAGVSLHTSGKSSKNTQKNTFVRNAITEYNINGKDLLADYREYKKALENYENEYKKYETALAKYAGNVNIQNYNALTSRPKKPDRTSLDKFEAALGKETIKTISDIENAYDTTFEKSSDFIDFYNDYNNRTTEIPSVEVVGPSVNNALRGAITESIYTNMAAANQFKKVREASSLREIEGNGYSLGKNVKKRNVEDIIGNKGENILQIDLNLEGMLADPSTAYALITTNEGSYYIPMQYISPSFGNVSGKSSVYAALIEAGIKDPTQFRKWNSDNKPELLKKTYDVINGLLPQYMRGLFNTPYYTASPSKGNR